MVHGLGQVRQAFAAPCTEVPVCVCASLSGVRGESVPRVPLPVSSGPYLFSTVSLLPIRPSFSLRAPHPSVLSRLVHIIPLPHSYHFSLFSVQTLHLTPYCALHPHIITFLSFLAVWSSSHLILVLLHVPFFHAMILNSLQLNDLHFLVCRTKIIIGR